MELNLLNAKIQAKQVQINNEKDATQKEIFKKDFQILNHQKQIELIRISLKPLRNNSTMALEIVFCLL